MFSYSEAIRVYNCLSNPQTIVIMGWIADQNMHDVIEKEIEFFIFNLERLEIAINCAKQLNRKANIHIEAETGMNRSGLGKEELKKQLIPLIKANQDYLNVVGLCTHLAGAESISNHSRIRKQLKKYDKIAKVLEEKAIIPKYKHVANSAASFIYPKARMDIVRIGIMLYGFWSSTEVFIQYMHNRDNKTDPLNISMVKQFKNIQSKDVIPLENTLLMIGDNTLYQFVYIENGVQQISAYALN